jgi:simple sugar transport system ATP-binding protein
VDTGGDAVTAPALQLIDISKRFPGVLANDRISLHVGRGEVLGLLGENGAGKTTLMNIVYGLERPDSGSIHVRGEEVSIRGPQEAVEHGIGMIHQHFMLVPDMTVAENVALGPSRAPGWTRLPDVERDLDELSKRFGLAVDPRAEVRTLTVGARQRCEIIKMLYHGAEILILDEPTAALGADEWEQFALFVRAMADEGKSVIFITHKLDELFGLVDRCTVLRDGAVVGTVAIDETSTAALAAMMVGREVELRAERPIVQPGQSVLEVSQLTLEVEERRLLDDISFEVRSGEVFGVAGVAGNGQSVLVEALIGLRRVTAGALKIDGELHDDLDPKKFTELGGALIPEDRHEHGLALDLTLQDNLMLKEFDRPRYARRGILNQRRATAHAGPLLSAYNVKAPSLQVPARQLSGGNQQKIVLARELSRKPGILIACQPTRGLDVGAAQFVYGQINDAKRAGCAILLVSFELDEILSLADRFTVMVGGRLLATLAADEADTERVGMLMGGAR